MPDEVLDGDAIEEQEESRSSPGNALEVAAPPPPGPADLTVAPIVTAAELGQRLDVIQEAMEDKMKEGVDYGKVPGTDKPALFKPGAEKLSVLFQLDVQPRSHKHWGPGHHLTVETQATVFDIRTGARVGFGEGLCTTHEKKYGKRKANLVCPECHTENVRRSKQKDEFYCWQKIGGCGATFDTDDERITGQELGYLENPDLPDTWNTVIKMAAKRAKVDAVLAVTGASAIFTQDIADSDDTPGDVSSLPPANEEQRATLNAALMYLLPEGEARKAWGEIKQAFGGELYGPVAEAVVAPIRARKAIEDDTASSDEEAAADAQAQKESAESPEERREREAREKAGRKRKAPKKGAKG